MTKFVSLIRTEMKKYGLITQTKVQLLLMNQNFRIKKTVIIFMKQLSWKKDKFTFPSLI